MEEEIKRWTARRKSAQVLEIIQGKTTVSEVDVASRIGIPKHTLYGWVQAARQTARAPNATVVPSDSAEIRRHGSAGGLPPVEFERRYAQSGN